VSNAAPSPVKISFRRDVRTFFSLLAAFFIVLIGVLLLLLQQVLADARDATWRYWNSVADNAAMQAAAAARSPSAPDASAIFTPILGRQDVIGGEFELRTSDRVQLGTTNRDIGAQPITRQGEWGRLTLYFDATPLAAQRRTLLFTSVIALSAALTAVILVLLYIPRITGPIEKMLDHAAEVERRDPAIDEQDFLIETFRKSVATLKSQQEELRMLHDVQKSRADDFERVTAALMRGLTSGLVAIGKDERIADVNDVAREILHIPSATDVIGKDVREALGEGGFADAIADALRRRVPLSRVETEHRAHDGTSLVIGVTTVPLLNESGDLLGMLALFTDLTSIRALESRVRDLQTLADLGEMSAGIAHEFRNSLSAILGYLKLAQRDQDDASSIDKVRRAEEEASQLSAAVASLLSFTKPMSVHPEPVHLRELVTSVVSRLETMTNGVRVSIEGDAVVAGDRALLSRALENVLRNALESVHAKNDSEGRVDVTIDDKRARIRIRDNGVGFDSEHAARLFLPFQSDKPGGFGLGLALTKKIVLLHGGTIRLSGERGAGALVDIELKAPALPFVTKASD